MRFSNSFEVPLPAHRAWPLLLDVRRIAPCMPGAKLTEVVDDKTYKGKVAVRLGPVALSFAGTVKFETIDAEARTARVKAQGSDVKGRGGASAVVDFALEPLEGGTKVVIATDLNLSGSVAQYGRASGMIQSVAAQLIDQFAASLRGEIGRTDAAAADRHDMAPGADQLSADAVTTPVAPTIPPASPISGLSLLARAVWDMLRGWFRRGSSAP
jgi:carbon monoxide dehydrogenase subunit G